MVHSVASADAETVVDCHRFAMIYDAEQETCVDPEPTGAASVMAPLLGASGSMISGEELRVVAENNAPIDIASMLSEGEAEAGEANDICNNGIYSDGCENGTKRLCTLIPNAPTVPLQIPHVMLMLSMSGSMAGMRIRTARKTRKRDTKQKSPASAKTHQVLKKTKQ